jgi:hypothetical protein
MDAPLSGKPPVISAGKRLEALEVPTRTPPDASTRWSEAKLARATGLPKATVHRILSEGALKVHRDEYWFGRGPDPEFEEKQAAFLGLYLNTPENVRLLSVDEKTQLQTIDRTHPALPMSLGKSRKLTASYKKNGTHSLLADFSVHEGLVTARTIDSNNHEAFLSILKRLYRENPGRHLHMIVDNLYVHKHRKVRYGSRSAGTVAPSHFDLCLLAQPDRNLVQHLQPGCVERRSPEIQKGTGRADPARYQEIHQGAGASFQMDGYQKTIDRLIV